MEPKEYKFCPSCHLINGADAVFCEHCGKSFDSASVDYSTTTRTGKETKFFPEGLSEKIEKMNTQAPAKGIAVYVPDTTRPVAIRLDDEFVIGRLTDGPEEKIVDLTPYKAYDQGVSRRHVMVRRTGNECNLIDLNSTNGTWINEKGLVPQRPYPVKSGSQIRLGKMRIFMIFR